MLRNPQNYQQITVRQSNSVRVRMARNLGEKKLAQIVFLDEAGATVGAALLTLAGLEELKRKAGLLLDLAKKMR